MEIPDMYYVYVRDVDGSVVEYSGLCVEVVADKTVEKLKSTCANAWKVKAEPGPRETSDVMIAALQGVTDG